MKPLAIAHRGYHQYFYENTYDAFKEASKLNYYGIETDVHLTKDNKWITNHNDYIVSKQKTYQISELTLEEILSLPLDNPNNLNTYVCRVEDYLNICKENNKKPVIEIKNSPKREYLLNLASIIEDIIGIENVTIIAFSLDALLVFKNLYQDKVTLELLIDKDDSLVDVAISHKLNIDMDCRYLTKEIIDKMHLNNLTVNSWTVDDINLLRKLESYNIDFITSNIFNQKS